MTKAIKPTRRETFTSVRERGQSRPIVITLNSTYITIKLKGMRYSYSVTYDAIWSLGAKIQAEHERSERRARRIRKP